MQYKMRATTFKSKNAWRRDNPGFQEWNSATIEKHDLFLNLSIYFSFPLFRFCPGRRFLRHPLPVLYSRSNDQECIRIEPYWIKKCQAVTNKIDMQVGSPLVSIEILHYLFVSPEIKSQVYNVLRLESSVFGNGRYGFVVQCGVDGEC